MWKRAVAASPISSPSSPPHSVRTTPSVDTTRMQWFPVSETAIAPSGSSARALGRENVAVSPVPSLYPCSPVPTQVVTAPDARFNFRMQ